MHDIGKTRIPLEILKKPSALDKRERRMMEAHTTYGAEILVEVDGLRPLTPTVALEHHRGVDGTGYPDLEAATPHLLSQVVAVADIYEAMTGARSYQEPAMPEQACLVLARLAGTKLNTALVKAFVNAISFFPLGSVVRTDRDEIGVVVRTTSGEPLHPVIALIGADHQRLPDEIDTSRRLLSGQYERHVVETLRPTEGLDLNRSSRRRSGTFVRRGLRDTKPNSRRRCRRPQHPANDREYVAELRVIPLLELVEPGRQVLVLGEHSSQAHERAHDRYVDDDRASAAEHAGKHGHALLGKHVGSVPSSSVLTACT